MFVCVPLRMMLFGALVFWTVVLMVASRELDERGDDAGARRLTGSSVLLTIVGIMWLTAEWVVYLQ